MKLQPKQIPLDDLLFDPNNYRFLNLPSYKRVEERRTHEKRVQEHTFRLLRDTPEFELATLKESILTNGFVPLDRIVISKYHADPSKWLVIEGNRRLAAVRWLLEDHEAAVHSLTREQLNSLKKLDCLVFDMDEPENAGAVQVLMAIRHVSGVKPWAAYQQARLVVEMIDDLHLSIQEVSERISLSVRETVRRYRASKALQQMELDDEFQDYAEAHLYAFFHEAVGQPVVRDWLGWNDQTYCFENDENRRHFYELLIPRVEDDQKKQPKLSSALTHVRQLKVILQDPKATRILLDPERPFEDAYSAAKQTETTKDALYEFDDVIQSTLTFLNSIPASVLKQLSDDQLKLLDSLRQQLDEVINDVNRLRVR